MLACLTTEAEDAHSQLIQLWLHQQIHFLRDRWDQMSPDIPEFGAAFDFTQAWDIGIEQLSQSLAGETLAIAIPLAAPLTKGAAKATVKVTTPATTYAVQACHTTICLDQPDVSTEILPGEILPLALLQELQQRDWQSAWGLELASEIPAADATVEHPGGTPIDSDLPPAETLGWLIALPLSLSSELEPWAEILQTARSQLLQQAAQLFVQYWYQARSQYDLIQQNRTLQVRNRELQQVSQLKSEFLANTSHEIRTPLSSILGFTHLLREQGFNPGSQRHQEYLSIILSSGKHLLALINDILDLSKIEANQLDLNWDQVEVEPLCRTVLSLVQEKANDRGLKLELTIAPDLPILSADPLRLKQMLFNLLSNALKFTQAGSVGLRVTCAEQQMYFTVWDTGIGIPAEQLVLLFRPYGQLPQSADRQAEGTGLGLALTQKLAELHQGRIEVQSSPDQGSQFTVILPLQLPAPTESSDRSEPGSSLSFSQNSSQGSGQGTNSLKRSVFATASQATASQAGLTDNLTRDRPPVRPEAISTNCPTPSQPSAAKALRPLRSYPILLVEDNPHNAQLILAYLCKLGYEITWVRNHREMWEALKQSDPALILMDIHLPEVDGFTLIQRLRELPDYRLLPIIAQTALAMSGDRERCLEAGATDYVTKPIDLKQLAQVLERYQKPA